ncbi:uncharacterized protein [Diadema antillarum]|uniref:uncharacterized protein n=1 Tax=Diadema antillarum TaxID=105358 RepID=UPI003A838A32
MGTKVSKNQGGEASKKVKAVAAFQLAGKNAVKRAAIQAAKDSLAAKVLQKGDFNLPPKPPPPANVADWACLEASSSCGFPIPALVHTEFNVNARHGGGTALLLLTRGKSDGDSSEVTFLRCGFDGNHFSTKSLAQGGEHSIYNWNEIFTNCDGYLQPKLIFGHAHATIITNIASYGHGGCGVLFDGPKAGSYDSTADITPSPHISTTSDSDGSCVLVVCSAEPNKAGAVPSQTYLVHFKRDGNITKVPLYPDGIDMWEFLSQDGALQMSGPSHSHYAMFHSKSMRFCESHISRPRGRVVHLQEFSGTTATTLLENADKYVGRTMLLLCSHSLTDEDSTTSALYQIALMKGQVGVAYIAGLTGMMDSPDVWTVSLVNGQMLTVVGPSGPCRYAFFSNIPENVPVPEQRCFQQGCLATGSSQRIQGGLILNGDLVTLWVDIVAKVLLTVNGSTIQAVEMGDWTEQPDGRLAFQRNLTDNEKSAGLKVFRAFAVLKDLNGTDVSIEIEGSPCRVIKQPPGVAFALNCGGPSYEALNGVVFNDNQTMFRMDGDKGLQCVRKYYPCTSAGRNFHAIIGNTYDTYMHSSMNCSHNGFQNEVKFEMPIPPGDYTLRIYSVAENLMHADIRDATGTFTSKIRSQLKAIRNDVEGLTGKTCEVPLSVSENDGTCIYFNTNGGDVRPSALLVYDKNFVEPSLSDEEKTEEKKKKQELADKLLPISRSFVMKEMKIAGWSANLLQNASGEIGNMSVWNYGGDFKVIDGGDGTEKMFVTSFMQCTKSQDIDLTQHFSEKHLDSAPEIQVGESFHEGCNQGGYYSFTVYLSDANGEVISKQSTGMKGSISKSGWIRESFNFRDYGPGVRIITFESSGKDNKYWGGHFGTRMSAGFVRVKNEISPANDDVFDDVETMSEENRGRDITTFLNQLVAKHKSALDDISSQKENEKPQKKSQAQEAAVAFNTTPGDFQPSRIATRLGKREIRVFVSSTFRDFGEERELIIKKVFREVNRLCLDRGVFFTYVDLRWGITEKDTQDGKTIAICLREIDKCRPYFICLVGDRFGWSQKEEKPDDTLNKSFDYAQENHRELSWIDAYRYGSSVTQLEVLHGAMRPHVDIRKDRVRFYVRQSRVKRDELPPAEDKEAKGETQWHFDQQQQLRETILGSGYPCKVFEGALDASAMIREDLRQCIDEDFPPGTNLTHLEQEREAHLAFAEARRRVYIGRQAYFNAIDDYFSSHKKKPLTIVGESGSGKSALIANWSGRFQESNPKAFLFLHFIGSSAESASHLNLLRRLYEEMKEFYRLDLEVPTSDRNLVIDLPSWLKIAGNRSKVMIVLDALNQLDSGAGGSGDEMELKWMVAELPPNVYMLLSTLPGKAQDKVLEFCWPTYKVEPLKDEEKHEIITGYMNLYGKSLNAEQSDLIITAPQSSNPLYLKALLDEVRIYGSFNQLTTAIKSYLAADNPGKLFGKILERMEDDFEKGSLSRPNLVRDTTTAIWCSHRGMSENELLTLLDVPGFVWSPFYLSLEENLINRNGLVNFFHDHLRQAVESRYLPTPEDKRQCYLRLANFFNAQDIDDRYADEVPFLLAQAGELTRLRGTILNIEVFQRLMSTEEGKFQLIKSWRLLGGFEPVEQAYLDVLSRSEEWEKSRSKVRLIQLMAVFFTTLGLLRGARVLNERLLKEMELQYLVEHSTVVQHHFHYNTKHRCNHPVVIDVLIELGNVCIKQGNLEAADKHLEDALTRLTKIKTPEQKLQLVKTLISLGAVKRKQGQAELAKKILQKAFSVSIEVVGHDHHYTAALVGQLGELCYDQSRLEEASLFHCWDFQQTSKETGMDHPRLAAILNNLGLVQDDLHDASAENTFKLALGILLEAYGKDHVDVAIIRYNLGARFFGNNYLQRAKYQLQEAHRIFELFLGEEHSSTVEAKKAYKMVEQLSA